MHGINPRNDGELAKYLALAAGKTQKRDELNRERKAKEKSKRRSLNKVQRKSRKKNAK